MNKRDEGMEVLRRVLRRMRWDDQDGYLSVGDDGKFAGNAGFVTRALPFATPEELDALFELAGIVPDPIVSKGDCETCAHAYDDGTERGYSSPCLGCKRPQMSNYDLKPEWLVRGSREAVAYGDRRCHCPLCEGRRKQREAQDAQRA